MYPVELVKVACILCNYSRCGQAGLDTPIMKKEKKLVILLFAINDLPFPYSNFLFVPEAQEKIEPLSITS